MLKIFHPTYILCAGGWEVCGMNHKGGYWLLRCMNSLHSYAAKVRNHFKSISFKDYWEADVFDNAPQFPAIMIDSNISGDLILYDTVRHVYIPEIISYPPNEGKFLIDRKGVEYELVWYRERFTIPQKTGKIYEKGEFLHFLESFCELQKMERYEHLSSISEIMIEIKKYQNDLWNR